MKITFNLKEATGHASYAANVKRHHYLKSIPMLQILIIEDAMCFNYIVLHLFVLGGVLIEWFVLFAYWQIESLLLTEFYRFPKIHIFHIEFNKFFVFADRLWSRLVL